ncbi:hypothetical protein [Aggregatibacter actinomycetemcomitans]|nr:hypothetical protein [Aggregatibacter actinomycetemcomitans]
MIKNAGGVFCPADDIYLDKLKRLENGGLYEIELKKNKQSKIAPEIVRIF